MTTADEWNDTEPGPGFTFTRALTVLVVLAMIIFWIYVFANGSSVDHPDEFADESWTTAAEALCAERQAAIEALPNATTAESPQERAELVALGTAEIERMVQELADLGPPSDPKGAETVPQWLSDYEIYLQDRRDWTDILRTGDDPPFLLSGTDQGVRVTDVLGTYAEVNEMPSCSPSLDT